MKTFDESKERRREIGAVYEREVGKMHPGIRRMFLEYDRYSEAGKMLRYFEKEKVQLGEAFCVVDYGCGPGDYGFAFGRQDCMVLFYDFDHAIAFVNFRLTQEETPFGHLTMPRGPFGTNDKEIEIPQGGCQLAIFGEVLEHHTDPLGVLTRFADAGTTYLFTSSFPYRPDDDRHEYWAHDDHKHEARLQQPACRQLLETRYTKVANFGGQANLWKLK